MEIPSKGYLATINSTVEYSEVVHEFGQVHSTVEVCPRLTTEADELARGLKCSSRLSSFL
jgi:hypothetical protein